MFLFCKRLALVLGVILKTALNPNISKPKKLRLFFEESGGAFIKLGQILALRRDFFTDEYILELLNLLNNIPKTSFLEMRDVFTEEVGKTIDEVFSSFDEEPIGSASMAQVYKAVLRNGDKVAVKIRRPNIEKIFEIDFLIISFIAKAVDFLGLVSFLNAREVAKDFARWTRAELDFKRESENADAFLKFSLGSPLVKIPKQHKEYSSSKVLVQEFVDGVSALDVFLGKYDRRKLSEKKIDLDQMALRLICEGARQYFTDGFFHADPHPANLIFLPGDENFPGGRLAFVDFGMIGEAEKENRIILLKFVHAISVKNVDLMARRLLEYGKKNIKKEIDFYFSVKPEKQKIIDEIIEKIEDVAVSYFRAEVQEVFGLWLNEEQKQSSLLRERSSSLMFLSLVKRAEKYGVHLPLDIVLFFRGLAIDDMVALQISPQFDIMKALEIFFQENPVEKIEEKIKNQPNWAKIDSSVASVNDDWDAFIETSIAYKEKNAVMREKTVEMVFYYAERYPEVRDLLRKL